MPLLVSMASTIHVLVIFKTKDIFPFSLRGKYKARIFLLVDLRDFFSDLGSGGREKNK